MRIRTPLITLTLAAALASGPALATTYKWTDSEGNVHYSQNPPTDKDSVKIAPPPVVTPPKVETPADTQPTEKKSQQAPLSEEEQAKKAVEEQHQAEVYRIKCEAATKNMAIYKTSRRIKDSEGKIIRMSDEMRQDKVDAAQQAIDKYCK